MQIKAAWLLILAVSMGISSGESSAGEGETRRSPIVRIAAAASNSVVTIRRLKDESPPDSPGPVGSGVIIDERGYILTNEHVVAGTVRLPVALPGDAPVDASIVASSERLDLAILKARPGARWTTMPLGTSRDLLPGESVVVIGSPFGFRQSISRGIISGIGRSIDMPTGHNLSNMIQLDAPINPGNSGGAAFNILGEWIGMPSAIRDAADGVSFAIAADDIERFLIRKLGAASMRGEAHGITCHRQIASEDGPGRLRVLADAVETGSWADRTGIRPRDWLLAVDGRALVSCFDLERAFWFRGRADGARVELVRDGRRLTLP